MGLKCFRINIIKTIDLKNFIGRPTSRIETSVEIQNDVIQFIEQIKEDKPDLKNLGIKNTSFDEMMEILGDIFLGKAEA